MMMYETNWADEQQKTVYLAFNGVWESDDFSLAEQSLHQMLSQVGHPVSVVIHITEPRPISMTLVEQMQRFLSLDHPNRNQLVLVAPEGYLQGVHEVVRRLFHSDVPAHVHFTTSLNRAEEMLMGA